MGHDNDHDDEVRKQRESFDKLFRASVKRLRNYLAKQVGYEDAEDLLGEAWLCGRRFIERRNDIRSSSWIYRTSKNIYADYVRRRPPSSLGKYDENIAAPCLITLVDDTMYVDGILTTLNNEQRSVALLLSEGISRREIASILHISRPQVDRVVAKIRTRLEAALRREAALERELMRHGQNPRASRK